MPKIAINAHLLSSKAGYRSAGIHGSLFHTLLHLPDVAPDWAFYVFYGDGRPPEMNGLTPQQSLWRTDRPIQRILWEQMIQPFSIAKLKPDLYHSMAFISPLVCPAPSLVTIHDLSFIRFPGALSTARRAYLKAFTKRSCQQARRIIAVSQSTKRDLVDLLNISPDKISVTPPGVLPRFKPMEPGQIAEFRAKRHLPARFILHLGTLEPRKNLPMLLRAYAALPRDLRHEVHLVLAGGKGWQYDEIFHIIEQFKLTDTVHLPGYVADEELPLWYNAAEVFVYPSIFEGWGLPINEAMASGTPVMASNVSSMPEAVGDAGWLLSPSDELAWTAALTRILSDDTAQSALREAGLARAATFSWHKTAQRTLEAYQEALNDTVT